MEFTEADYHHQRLPLRRVMNPVNVLLRLNLMRKFGLLYLLFLGLTGCMVDGVCIGDKKTCNDEAKNPPGATTPAGGSGGFGTASDGCSNAGDIIGVWAKGADTLKFAKDCSFTLTRTTCNLTGTFSLPAAKGALMGIQDEDTAVALDTVGVSTFKITIAKGTTKAGDEYCPTVPSTLTCDVTFDNSNELNSTGCVYVNSTSTATKFFQKKYDRN